MCDISVNHQLRGSNLPTDWTSGLFGSLRVSNHGLHYLPLLRAHLTNDKQDEKTKGFPLKEILDCYTNLAKVVKLASHGHKFTSIKADHLKETHL